MTDELDRMNNWKPTFDAVAYGEAHRASSTVFLDAVRAAELHGHKNGHADGYREGVEAAVTKILFMATPEDTISDAIDEIRALIPGPGSEADCHAPDERKEN